MCGIVAVISQNKDSNGTAKRIFKSLLEENESRGTHSTGVLAINKSENTFSLFKDTIKATDFVQRKKFKKIEGDIFIGHTRFATTGAISERNAHPLQRNRVILVHNGMISNHKEVAEKYNMKYEVDSEVLLPYVESENWDGLKDISGSANFIAWNMEKRFLYIERHNNPLYILRLPELGIMAFSSQFTVLDLLGKHYEGEVSMAFPDDTLWKLTELGEVEESRKVEYKSYPSYQGHYSNYKGKKDKGFSKTVQDALDEEFKPKVVQPHQEWEYDKDGKLLPNKQRTIPADILDDEEDWSTLDERDSKSASKYAQLALHQECMGCEKDVTYEEFADSWEMWKTCLCKDCAELMVEAVDLVDSGYGELIDTDPRYKDILKPIYEYKRTITMEDDDELEGSMPYSY